MSATRKPNGSAMNAKLTTETIKGFFKGAVWGRQMQHNDQWFTAVPTTIAKNVAIGDIVLVAMSHGRFAFKQVVSLETEKFSKDTHYTLYTTKDLSFSK